MPIGASDAMWLAKFFGPARLSPLPQLELRRLSRVLKPVALEAGEVLFRRGAMPEGVWILQTGSVELVTGEGPRKAVVRLSGAGDSVGDAQLLSGEAAPYTARVAGAGAAFFLGRSGFEEVLAGNPALARRWAAKLARQVAQNQMRIMELLGRDLRQRTARLLLHEARGGAFRHSQSTCAAMLGVHRSPLNQVLRDLEKGGLVSLGYRDIRVLDPAGLSRIAG